jgi:hypothetical protein
MESSTSGQQPQEMNEEQFVAIVEEGKALNEQLWADIKQLDALMQSKGKIKPSTSYQCPEGLFKDLIEWTPYATTAELGLTFNSFSRAVLELCRGISRHQEEFTQDPANYNIRIDMIQDQDFWPLVDSEETVPVRISSNKNAGGG